MRWLLRIMKLNYHFYTFANLWKQFIHNYRNLKCWREIKTNFQCVKDSKLIKTWWINVWPKKSLHYPKINCNFTSLILGLSFSLEKAFYILSTSLWIQTGSEQALFEVQLVYMTMNNLMNNFLAFVISFPSFTRSDFFVEDKFRLLGIFKA